MNIAPITPSTRISSTVMKARGVKLGAANPKCRGNLDRAAAARGRVRGTAAAATRASEHATYFGPIVAEMKGRGLTLQGIAAELNRMGYETRGGNHWNHVAVLRLLDRVSKVSAS